MPSVSVPNASILAIACMGRLFACSCTPAVSAPACEKLTTTPVVFLGTVLAAERDTRFPAPSRARVYRFQVDTIYKGLPANARQLVIDPGFVSCEQEYLPGKRYLVFASRVPETGEFFSGACHGSIMADYAKEDIRILETYRLQQAGNAVYGRVLQWLGSTYPRREEDAPVAGATVVLRNSTRFWTQRSAPDGGFRFENIPAGSYFLLARLDPYLSNPVSQTVEVPSVGCLERFPVLEAQASLSGVLVHESGRPAASKTVQLLRRNQSGNWFATSQFWTQTDDRGSFAFQGLPDGDYLLGYEIWRDRPSQYSPYPTSYFPGVPKRSRATVLHLAPKQAITRLRIPLNKPHTPRHIRVKVVWPDGRAPDKNLLQLLDGDDLIRNVGGFVPDAPPGLHRGMVTFTGYAERQYNLNVRYWIDDLGGPVPHEKQRIARSPIVRVPPGKAPASVKLILTATLLAVDEE